MNEDLMLPMEIDGESAGAADGRTTTKPRKKNRSPSPTTIRRDYAGGVVAETTTTGAWTGAKKAKLQEEGAPPASEDLDITAAAADVDVINPEPEQGGAAGQRVEGGAFDWTQVEGSDWTDADVKEEIESFDRRFGLPDGDDVEFWRFCDEKEAAELQRRIAMYHIRFYKGAELSDAQLWSMVQKDGVFRSYGPHDPDWYFDRRRCNIAGFQDYQRLVLYNDCYLEWDDYDEACCTLESDQQYVLMWEKLLDKTKWLQHYHKLTPEERKKMDQVTSYHAAKIRAEFPLIFSRIVIFSLMELKYSVTIDHFYARVYFEVWKRVAKQKMNLKDALDEVKDEAMWPFRWVQVKNELESDNYKTCVAAIDKNLEEGEAYWLIVKAVGKIIPRLKTYYEYAKKKLGIAEKMGLIPSVPHTGHYKIREFRR